MEILLVLLAALPVFADEGDEAPEVTVGRRLFLETRFAQSVERPISCRACHLVNERQREPGAGVRAYTDFARRSPIPAREDGRTVTIRRTPILVNSTIPRPVPMFLHADGEFTTVEDLVRGGLTGRNFGWLPTEAEAAVRHAARIIREDDGNDVFARQTGGLSYAVLFLGTDRKIPPFVRIPEEFRLDVGKASDDQVLGAVAKLTGAYVDSLLFGVSRPDLGALYAGSPYDFFIVKNNLPKRPEKDESPAAYTRRLRKALDGLESPLWITSADWSFKLHNQPFRFGRRELDGLNVFLGAGKCAACHTPPAFTDFVFHNTGASQEEYDAVHGDGTFAGLSIPTLAQRNEVPDLYLPGTAARPGGQGMFRAPADRSKRGQTDLGLWNVFANDSMPAPQETLRSVLGASNPPTDADLARTIALFKTPTVRDLGQSGPYFHTGRKDTLESVVRHYAEYSESARAGRVRNADPKLREIVLSRADQEALAAFLRSLNEDYND